MVTQPLTQIYQKGFGILFGACSCLVIMFFAHQHLIDKNANFNPALTCKDPPTDCWDGFNKAHYKCMNYGKDTVLRSGVVARAGTRSCYKSVYFNLDHTSMYMFIWLLVWCTITTRAMESLVLAIINRKLRKRFAIAVLLGIPSVWYACSIPIHYLNDRYYPYFWSQIFFSVTELISFSVCTMNLWTDSNVPRWCNLLLTATAAAHMIQLVFDEEFLFFEGLVAGLRNLMLFVGDCSAFTAGWASIRNAKKAHLEVLGLSIVELMIFHFLFADDASASFRTE